MKLVYISNYLTMHQKSLAEQLYSLLGDDFCFIETVSAEQESSDKAYKRGFAYFQANSISNDSISWRYRAYSSPTECEKCKLLIEQCDVAVIGNATDSWIMERLKKGKLTFRAHERWYRKPLPLYRLPRAIFGAWLHHGRFNSLYMLCASAYTAIDVKKVHCFRKKVYTWGYFPETRRYRSIEEVIEKKASASILWAGRLVDWKHPEHAVMLADYLKQRGYDFELNILGIDESCTELKYMIDNMNLQDEVHLLGAADPNTVREYMEQSSIYLFTSDRNEGWGVVLNEAMNSGCAVVANHAIGAVPNLVKNEKNGLIYRSGDVNMLYEKVKQLLDDNMLCKRLGVAAYETIKNQWNAENAANRLISLSEAILNGDKYPDIFKDGVCSKAPYIRDDWF